MATCGTWQGYDEHRRRGEVSCRPCLEAKYALRTVADVRAGRRKSVRVPFALLGELLRYAPPDLLAWAEEELPPGTVQAAHLTATAQAVNEEVNVA